jgi:hypothetical protein
MRHRRPAASPVIWALAGLLGCAEHPDSIGFTEQPAGPANGGMGGLQGRAWLGTMDDLQGATAATYPSTTAGALTVGALLAGSDGASYQLTHVVTFATPSGAHIGYRWLRDGVPMCAHDHLALPIPGEVFRNGLPAGGQATRITWSCSEYRVDGTKDTAQLDRNGTAAKAITWGFAPYGSFTSLGGLAVTGRELHTVATRVGRADYCHAGVAHTIDGTAVALKDLVLGNAVPEATGPVETSPADVATPVDPTGLYLEAVWPRPSPTLGELDAARPLCLSKLRWSTLPPGHRCGGTLLDPRLAGPAGTARYCEDLATSAGGAYEDLAALGAVVVNASRWNDLGLRIWKAGGDHYTTTRGNHNGAAGADVPPAATYTYQQFLGTIVTSTGRDTWVAAYGAAAGTFVALHSYRKVSGANQGERLTTTGNPPAGYGDKVLEGYLWSTPPSQLILDDLGVEVAPLYRHQRALPFDFKTTTDAIVTGYPNRVTLGYLLTPRTW